MQRIVKGNMNYLKYIDLRNRIVRSIKLLIMNYHIVKKEIPTILEGFDKYKNIENLNNKKLKGMITTEFEYVCSDNLIIP